ncbi:MAG: hypothetical protein ABJB05_08690 [Parafilimonas sp.]
MNEQLPSFLLADLFPDSIVQIDSGNNVKPALKADNTQPGNFYLGDFKKKIIVLVSDETNTHISDENLSFLNGILDACKLNLSHIAIINFYNNAINFARLKKDILPEFLISFGIKALQIELPFTLPDYQVQEHSKCKIIIAPALNELNQQTENAKAEKIKLWKGLQKMFDL